VTILQGSRVKPQGGSQGEVDTRWVGRTGSGLFRYRSSEGISKVFVDSRNSPRWSARLEVCRL